MRIINLEQGSKEWHAWRQNIVGGSDAPAVMGESPYKTIRELYFEKQGIDIVEEEKSKAFIFERGKALEDIARRDVYSLTKYEFMPICAEHDTIAGLGASFDGYNQSFGGPLEVKLVGAEVLKRAIEHDEIPRHHWIQLQHEMNICDGDEGLWFGGTPKKDGTIKIIKRSKQFLSELTEKELLFLENVRLQNEYPLGDDDYYVPKDQALLERLALAKAALDQAEEDFQALKKAAIDTYKHKKIAGHDIRIYNSTRAGSISYKDLPEVKALDKDYLEKFRGKPSNVWTVKAKTRSESNEQ